MDGLPWIRGVRLAVALVTAFTAMSAVAFGQGAHRGSGGLHRDPSGTVGTSRSTQNYKQTCRSEVGPLRRHYPSTGRSSRRLRIIIRLTNIPAQRDKACMAGFKVERILNWG